MSIRNRQEVQVTGKVKLSKDDRRGDRRRERHSTKVLLNSDMDNVGSSDTTRHKEAPHVGHVPSEPEKKRYRHWKSAFWKRRNQERHLRNLKQKQAEDGLLPTTFEEPNPDPYAHLYPEEPEVMTPVRTV